MTREIANLEFQITWSTNNIRYIAMDKDITNRKSGRFSLMAFHLAEIRKCKKKLQTIKESLDN